jgi:DNA uptake protein ComE-like DNA-binding protein
MINSWEAYFIFSEKERKGIIVLGVILTLSIVFTLLVPHKKELVGKTSPLTIPKLHLFTFDPNTIDSANAIHLGIPLKQVNTLMHYREKGGRFYKKEDILKLYGLDPVIAHQLIPFIELKPTENLSKWGRYTTNDKGNNYKSNYDDARTYKTNNYKEKNYAPWLKIKNGSASWTIDINEAGAKEWHDKTKLPMNIVHQIINFKNHLGGFTHTLQLKKVYGLADTAFQNLRPHLVVQKNFKPLLNSSTMNFAQWKSLGIFEDQQIFEILKMRKQQGGQVSWRELVILFDLPEKQAIWLKSRIIISD